MTLFASILAGLGLSQPEAAAYLDVRPDTIKSWGAGRNPVPPGVYERLHALGERQEDAAQAIMDAWEESDRPADIEYAVPDATEIRRRGWPSEGAFVTIARRAWEMMGPDVTLRLVPAGSTEATRAAERDRRYLEP